MRRSVQPFLKNEFYLHQNKKSFPYDRLNTQPRFDTEARGNSEMACSSGGKHSLNPAVSAGKTQGVDWLTGLTLSLNGWK